MHLLLKKENGTITVYLVIVFTVILFFAGLFADLGRIKAAQNILRRIADSSTRSVLADYHTGLKNSYMLFGANESEFTADFEKYIAVNLPDISLDNFTLLDMRYEEGNIYLTRPVGRNEVLRQQILEAMKYKAPVEITRELIDKFRQVGEMARFFDVNNEKNKSCSIINEKLESIHENNRNIKDYAKELRENKTELANVKREITRLKKSDSDSAEDRLGELIQRKARLESEMAANRSVIAEEINKVEAARNEIEREIKKLEEFPDSDVYQNYGSRGSGVEVSGEEIVNRAMETFIDQASLDQRGIAAGVNKTRAALAAEIDDQETDDRIFEKIGIDAIAGAHERILAGKKVPVSPETVGTVQHAEKLRDEIEQYTSGTEKGADDIEALFSPEVIDGDIRRFEDEYGSRTDSISGLFRKIYGIINVGERLVELRDEIFINEYVLTYFSYMTTEPKGGPLYPYRNTEAEYICYGTKAPMALAVSELYFTRFALDSAAYFAFSKAPADLTARMVYSLIMGALEATVDTYKLLVSGESVPVASMFPDSPLEKTPPLNYKDHLRLFMLLHSAEKAKLARIDQLIRERSGIDTGKLPTLADGYITVSVKMWFLPLNGFSNLKAGPFGTVIRDGRCYITKRVELGYQ
ncbi:hypothetical protein [Phosphitispora sp. TUW77]|uniref:hypothetical protein n=1 Tax=Phosphitispora sp. TUW77 TaxID=3152361 RepID=UPI003AB466B6